MMTARDALNALAKLGISIAGALGTKDEVDPISIWSSPLPSGAVCR